MKAGQAGLNCDADYQEVERVERQTLGFPALRLTTNQEFWTGRIAATVVVNDPAPAPLYQPLPAFGQTPHKLAVPT